MKYVFCLIALVLDGCSAPVAYDKQFSTLETVDADGVARTHAWVIGPTRLQAAEFEVRAKR